MTADNKIVASDRLCAKEKLKPWLVGLGVLIIIVVGWMLLGKEWRKSGRVWEDRMFSGKTDFPAPIRSANRPGQASTEQAQDSYHSVVQLVRPAVVGIRLLDAGPFFQKWGTAETQMPDLAWRRCPHCGWVAVSPPDNPLTPVFCPNCGTNLGQNLQAQNQAWPQPNQFQPGQTQVGNFAGQGFGANLLTMSCPNCGIAVTRQAGIPWASISCPNCGSPMFCPRFPDNLPRGRPGVWMQPTAQQVPPETFQNGPTPSPGQEAAMPGFQGIGSGLIVSKRGYVLTNSHLVSGQKSVTVTLFTPQGQNSFKGQVVAQAPDRDLAVIKIEPQNVDLPVAPMGDSDTIEVGNVVLAFGNPFGLSQTVTSGIISAVRASMVIEGHQLNNLIQTDAPINQGNSGGPLVNLNGEVIGINTAIYSPAQTHTGLGFAVPINQAKEVFASYMDEPVRKVGFQFSGYLDPRAYPAAGQMAEPEAGVPESAPAWLGINIQILNDILAEQLNVPVDRGILVNEVYPNSPAAEAGLKRGDVIIRFDGKRVTDETRIRSLLAEKKPGDRVRLTVVRGRKRQEIKFGVAGGSRWQAQPVIMGNRKVNLLKNAEIEPGNAEITSLGIGAVTISPEIAFTYGLPSDTRGVIATETEGLALSCGIRDGDIIAKVNNRPTPDLISFLEAIKKGDLSKGIIFSLIRRGRPMEIVMEEKPQLLPRGL